MKKNVSNIFVLRKSKKNANGKSPIYVRLSIDGLREEISTGIRIAESVWVAELKQVAESESNHKLHNKRLRQIQTDLERLEDLVQASEEIATPARAFAAYRTPVRGVKIHEERDKNLALSEAVDETVQNYLAYNRRFEEAHLDGKVPVPPLQRRLSDERIDITRTIEKLAKDGRTTFDDKYWEKTLLLAINEHLLNFMEISFAGHRSPNTLEKMWGRKKCYLEFLEFRYGVSDIPLHKLRRFANCPCAH